MVGDLAVLDNEATEIQLLGADSQILLACMSFGCGWAFGLWLEYASKIFCVTPPATLPCAHPSHLSPKLFTLFSGNIALPKSYLKSPQSSSAGAAFVVPVWTAPTGLI
jgi:hypothetical protein